MIEKKVFLKYNRKRPYRHTNSDMKPVYTTSTLESIPLETNHEKDSETSRFETIALLRKKTRREKKCLKTQSLGYWYSKKLNHLEKKKQL